MNFRIFITLIFTLFCLSCVSINKENSTLDINLIIPGKTAEGYTLGDRVDNKSETVYLKDSEDVGDLMNLDCFSELRFDSFIYKNSTSVLFLNKGIIIAIAGLKIERRTTSDAVLLSKGIDNFILNYGNKGLSTFTIGSHRVYYYRELGIAVFNDDNDNSIDMYIIFKN